VRTATTPSFSSDRVAFSSAPSQLSDLEGLKFSLRVKLKNRRRKNVFCPQDFYRKEPSG